MPRSYNPPDAMPVSPFKPGESPFWIKGGAYRGHFSYVEEHVPGGVEAMLRACPNPELRAFYQQPFLASGFYDVFPLALAGDICARLTSMSFGDFVVRRTQHQAREDLTGIHRTLLRLVSPQRIAIWMPRVLNQYFNFSDARARHVPSADRVECVYTGCPRPLAPWMIRVTTSYLLTVLDEVGHRGFAVELERPVHDGADLCVPLVKLGFVVRRADSVADHRAA